MSRAPTPRSGVRAVAVVFVANGVAFASLFARVPDVRRGLALDNGSLGVLLLGAALGSVVSLPASGRLVQRWGAAAVVRLGSVVGTAGLLAVALGVEAAASVPLSATGLVAVGVGVGMWDVAMNAEGAEVERALGRTVMPRFHAGFSLGAVGGALGGAGVLALGAGMTPHLLVVAGAVVPAVWWSTSGFLPVAEPVGDGVRASALAAWAEPRTLVVGSMVLCFAVAEGSANDWLALALVDGHDAPPAVGVAGYAVFVAAMTAGRLGGPPVLDRFGPARVLATGAVAVAVGVVVTVLSPAGPLVAVGIVLWGLGAALGFPVGMSVAADDPRYAAARLAVVSTIGYGAFLAGPPLLGWLGDAVGTLPALLAVAALMAPALLTVAATRHPRGPDQPRSPPGTQSTSPRSRLACRARMNSRSESRLR